MCFLDLGVEDPVTDATTIWVSRDALANAGLGEKLLTGGLHCARRPARRWLRLCNPSPSGKPRSPPSRRRCPPPDLVADVGELGNLSSFGCVHGRVRCIPFADQLVRLVHVCVMSPRWVVQVEC